MYWKNIKSKDLKGLAIKLSLEQVNKKRRSDHPVYWYYLDGKKMLRIKFPNIHGGSGSISTGFLTSIRKSLRLKTRQFEDLVECPLSAEEFEKIIRASL